MHIVNKLDKDVYTNAELQENYAILKAKWGEWVIFGEDGAGISVKYINVGKAMFSGLMKTYTILMSLSLISAIALGKIILPSLVKMYSENNEQLVDLATLNTMQQVNDMAGKTNKKAKKEWF